MTAMSKILDQYYTKPECAKKFYDEIKSKIDLNQADVLLEPSAGTGSFFNLMDRSKRVGLDLDPRCPEIDTQDFLEWCAPINKKIYTIGNPPFGRNSNLAVKFFNHAAEFSNAIAFILPKTFRKISIINRLNLYFHLTYDEDVLQNSFIFENKSYDVSCCSQIWIKKSKKRKKYKVLRFKEFKNYFEIVEPELADFSIQRVGSAAGKIREENIKSNKYDYFIKQHHPEVLDIFKEIDFEIVKYNTAGNPSISANELLTLWKNIATTRGI